MTTRSNQGFETTTYRFIEEGPLSWGELEKGGSLYGGTQGRGEET